MRISQTKDLDLIQQLDVEWFGEDGFDDYEEAKWWIASEGSNLVAYAGLIFWGQGIAFLNRGCVNPLYRGLGIQKQLIRHRVSYCKRKKWKKAITYTSPDNLASANSLISCGFKLYAPANLYGLEDGLYFYRVI